MFVDFEALRAPRRDDPIAFGPARIQRRTIEFPTRRARPLSLAARKLSRRLSRLDFLLREHVSESLFTEIVHGLTRALSEIGADLYVAHNVETLLPAALAARRHDAALIFDCMEFYGDMGDGQSPIEARAIRHLEARLLPSCQLVLASSEDLADVLSNDYKLRAPLASYNVPPLVHRLPAKRGGGLNLYWRNSVIGFGQRGLEDILLAMALLPDDVHLFLQGRLPPGGEGVILRRAAEIGIVDQITLLPPYKPEEAVQAAAPYDVGLCLERRGPRNHDLTVSNKMFDYHMAGLAVVASNLPSLARIVNRSKGGGLFEPGNPASLAAVIRSLHASPETLLGLQAHARRFAVDEANLDLELSRIASAFRTAMDDFWENAR